MCWADRTPTPGRGLNVAHLLFHARHLEPLPAASAAGFMALLGSAVLLPAVLVWLAADGSAFREPDAAGRRPTP